MRTTKSVFSEPYISAISIHDEKPERKGKLTILGQHKHVVSGNAYSLSRPGRRYCHGEFVAL
jgi:hypothetical protein